MNTQNNYQLTPRKIEENKYTRARSMLLLVAALTAANVLLIACNASFYFPFSAYLPLLIISIVKSMAAVTVTALVVGIIISVVIAGIYVLLWYLSKKKTAFMAVALCLFAADTGIMLVCIDWTQVASSLMDILFHIWVMAYLIIALVAKNKLKTMPPDEKPTVAVPFREDYSASEPNEYNTVGTTAATPEEEKVELKTTPMYAYEGGGEMRMDVLCGGKSVKVMRSFGQTELVIDGQVYDRYERIIEEAYTLGASVDGNAVTYKQNADGECTLTYNNEKIAEAKVNV